MAYGGNFFSAFLVHLDGAKYNEIYIHFCHAQKHVTNRIWYEYHS